MLSDPDIRPHHLYRLRDTAGRLLYVGISASVGYRMRQHQKTTRWWPMVASIEYEEHPSRYAAVDAEKAAIVTERPALNVMHDADLEAARCNGALVRNVAADENAWWLGMRVAQVRGESLNQVIREALDRYVSEHRHLLPADPAHPANA